jgi:GGDEF domain-containing protein
MTSIDFAQLGIERAHYDSMFDAVNGLPHGWALLLDRLEVALARSRRTGSLVAVFVLDEPRLFTEVQFDRVVASLRAQLRVDDTLARIGDRRLVIVCTDVVDDAEAARLARHMIHDAGVICALGVALSNADDSSDQLLARGIVAATTEDILVDEE